MFGLIVEGAPLSTSRQQPNTVASSSSHVSAVVPYNQVSPPFGSSTPGPSFKSTLKKAASPDGTFNVKVVKAKMSKLPNGKVEFERLEQMHVSIDERSANVHTITSAIQSKWGSNFVIVTPDGLEVDDSAGTQGKVTVYK